MAGNVSHIDAENLHSAIATWSGFVYQGKIAIYHVIRLLTEDANSHYYELQLDSLDDFAIFNDNDIISLHQVKAEKSSSYANYVDALNKLEERINDYPADNAYFHLAVENSTSVDTIHANHPNLEIYQYKNNNYFCGLDEIDECIETEIRRYHSSINNVELSTDENVKAIRFCIEEMILKQVIGIHAENHKGKLSIREGAFHLKIEFNSFKTKLDTDMAEWITSEEYFIHLFKKEINTCYQEYLLELVEDGIELDTNTQEKLSKYLIHISSLPKDDILKFVRSIFPHRTFKLKSIWDYGRVAPKEEELKDVFFLILKDITKSANIDGCKVSWQSNSNETYVPSAIESSDKSRVSRQIIKNITETDIEVAFENQNIITKSMNVPNVLAESNWIKDIDTNSETNRITQWTKTSLISIDNAKNELNND